MFAAAGLYAAAGHDAAADGHAAVNWVALLAVGEVLALGAIWHLYQTVTTAHLHRRWLDSRSIAEKLRHVTALAALGSPSLGIRFPPTLDTTDERSSWTNWYFRALVREAGVLPLKLWQPPVRDACRTLVSWWLIRDQARYHFATALRTGTANARVELARNVFFALTVILAGIHLAASFASELPLVRTFETALGLATVAFPVIATTLHTFANQLDLENAALRSAAALLRLRDAHRRLEESRDPSSSELTQVTITVSEALLGELVEWRGDLSVRPPLIP
jgi:hypothetical protein